MPSCKNLHDRSIVIFVKYREVSTRTILLIDLSMEIALYSCFGGHNKSVVKGEKRKRMSLI